MNVLFTIPHYYDPEASSGRRHGSSVAAPRARVQALSQCILSLHQHLGDKQYVMQLAQQRSAGANRELAAQVHVVICTSGGKHLLDQLPLDERFYHHHPSGVEPHLLGFECHTILRDRWGNYDYYGYLEDDLVLHDPWLLLKLGWFNKQVGVDKLLLPNRFERSRQPLAHKAYVDGDLSKAATSRWQDLQDTPQLKGVVLGEELLFVRPKNPHSGCFFLNAEQMAHWSSQPYFLDRDTSFIGPLESAATLGIMRAFKIYKPDRRQANFLEIEHFGSQFISQLRRP